jgi:hypothetical protein
MLLAVLSWFAVALYRKSLSTLRALQVLSDQITDLDADLPPRSKPFQPAIFADAGVLRANVEQRRTQREHRGQLRRDARIRRGKLLQNAR